MEKQRKKIFRKYELSGKNKKAILENFFREEWKQNENLNKECEENKQKIENKLKDTTNKLYEGKNQYQNKKMKNEGLGNKQEKGKIPIEMLKNNYYIADLEFKNKSNLNFVLAADLEKQRIKRIKRLEKENQQLIQNLQRNKSEQSYKQINEQNLQAKFYMKTGAIEFSDAKTTDRYKQQNLQLSFGERQNWKRSDDFRIKSQKTHFSPFQVNKQIRQQQRKQIEFYNTYEWPGYNFLRSGY